MRRQKGGLNEMDVRLTRIETGDQGTLGVLSVPGANPLYTLELPWRDNRQNVSCIPAGEYTARVTQSPRFGRVYHIQNVPGRSGVLIHSGNLAGDVGLGYLTHSHGCPLIGSYLGRLGSQLAVLASRMALTEFMLATGGEDLRLILEEALCSGA